MNSAVHRQRHCRIAAQSRKCRSVERRPLRASFHSGTRTALGARRGVLIGRSPPERFKKHSSQSTFRQDCYLATSPCGRQEFVSCLRHCLRQSPTSINGSTDQRTQHIHSETSVASAIRVVFVQERHDGRSRRAQIPSLQVKERARIRPKHASLAEVWRKRSPVVVSSLRHNQQLVQIRFDRSRHEGCPQRMSAE